MARLFGVELRQGTNSVTIPSERHITPLGAAVFERHANIVSSILGDNEATQYSLYSLQEQNRYLEVALKQRSSLIAELILRMPTKTDLQGTDYTKALQMACQEGYVSVVETLLSRGAN